MAETVSKTDDLNGGPADVTITFAIGGRQFEVDLSNRNAEAFAEMMQPWIAAARPAGGKPRRQADRERAKAIRAWALATGEQVGDRGRLPTHIVKKFDNRLGSAA